MRKYIPDELFNRIPFPESNREPAGIGGVVSAIMYKVPGVSDIAVQKEVWATICDFCHRTGALLERFVETARIITISPEYGDFMRIVSCGDNEGPKSQFVMNGDGKTITAESDGAYVVVSVCPRIDDAREDDDGKWSPKVPKYLLDDYAQAILHGSLMRIYAMFSEPWGNAAMARMHAVAYNNELNRLSYGLITGGMRKHLLVNVEDFIVNSGGNSANGNG